MKTQKTVLFVSTLPDLMKLSKPPASIFLGGGGGQAQELAELANDYTRIIIRNLWHHYQIPAPYPSTSGFAVFRTTTASMLCFICYISEVKADE